MKTALVIPSNRQHNLLHFLDQWEGNARWDLVIVVEDGPVKSFKLNEDDLLNAVLHHVSWNEIDEDLGEDSWIISRRDSAIRSYGFLLAYRLGADFIFTLDDDCLPLDTTFITDHLNNFTQTPMWVPSIPGQRTRGLPYNNLGKSKKVVMSVGLWEGVPDYDAIQTLAKERPPEELPMARVMPLGQYFPICGMNLCFIREIACLAYFPLMGEGYPYRRFDDIWFGVICKKICDHLGLQITCGFPYINHSRASDPFVNLVKEAPGIAFNEEFWCHIDQIKLTGITPNVCLAEIGLALKGNKNEYLDKLGQSLLVWNKLFLNHQSIV
jgi:reversibly glycosylated polypeptide/UDP-arabinopyranose mutase